MEKNPRFDVKYLPEAIEFISSIDLKARIKVQYNINLSRYEQRKDLLKKLNDNIWEFRTLFNGKAYRLFAFWDNDSQAMILATHGIIKKTQKTPLKEIEKAERIMKRYFEEKTNK
ncbi:MAG: type II toxin-antitoxin system RelE/ParE family toxin [Muribaculaceae bacterium]|nr:type II toxin-antitoxin system RelE/ParE family toxin [Muribaculaceae bacterium]